MLSGECPSTPDALYGDATLAWRRRTRSKETFVSQVPQSYGTGDSHLNVALKARRLPEREPESLSVEDGEAALGYLRAFAGAESRPFCDGALYEASSSEGHWARGGVRHARVPRRCVSSQPRRCAAALEAGVNE